MVVLMGGKDSVGFRQFTELTVKAFLACRPYGQAVADTTSLMLAAEFPSFKGEPTIQRLTERFRLDLTEADAADYMRGVVNNAYQNVRSLVYDEFQLKTNGIPYVRVSSGFRLERRSKIVGLIVSPHAVIDSL